MVGSEVKCSVLELPLDGCDKRPDGRRGLKRVVMCN
jgi:hypothetical protein